MTISPNGIEDEVPWQLIEGFLEQADALRCFEALGNEIEWSQHSIQMFGRKVPAPRLTALLGETGLSYRYSGTRHRAQAWPATARPLLHQVSAHCGVPFNSALANFYRDGSDSVGWHSDDERDLGAAPVIASLSLGASRRFSVKPRSGGRSVSFDLPSGSLLVMADGFQRRFQHAVPKTKVAVGSRINLTFRRLVGP